MRGAPKIDPTSFGSFASDSPGGEGTPGPNTHHLFGVAPASTAQIPDDATTTINNNTATGSQISDLDNSPFSPLSPSSTTTTTNINRSKARRNSAVTPGIEHPNSTINGDDSTSSSKINSNNNNNYSVDNVELIEPIRRKSSSSSNSFGLFGVGGRDGVSDNSNLNKETNDNHGGVGFKSESSKRRPDRVSTSSADSSTTMDQNASRTKRVWKALSVASGEISKEKDKVLGFFRNRLRSKRGRKETSVKEIHIDPEIYDDKWASRAASSNSNCSRASSGSLKYSNSSSHSSSSRESTTLEVVHDMEEEYNPEYT